jgi:hypothetical protein
LVFYQLPELGFQKSYQGLQTAEDELQAIESLGTLSFSQQRGSAALHPDTWYEVCFHRQEVLAMQLWFW